MDDSIKRELLDKRQIKGSNEIINSRGSGSPTTIKIFSAGMMDLSVDETNHVVANVPLSELALIFGSTHRIYERIAQVCDANYVGDNVYDWFLYERRDDAEEVESMQVITNAKYSNGTLHLRYNESVTSRILKLQKDYTIYRLGDIYALKSGYSLRLYQILKSRYDKDTYITHEKGLKMFEYNVTELKFEIGAVTDCGDRKIKAELAKEYPNYDYIEELLLEKPDVSYKEFKVFNRDCVKKAVEEVTKKTILNVQCEKGQKSGRNVKTIRFYVDYKPEEKGKDKTDGGGVVNVNPNTVNQGGVLNRVSKALIGDFEVTEIQAICRVANYVEEDIMRAYDYMKNYPYPIKTTPAAFMSSCIKERWFDSKFEDKRTSSNKFNNFEKRDEVVDWDEFESRLLDN